LDFVQNFDLDFPDLKNMMNIPEFDNSFWGDAE
jgi:hypothetical protein